MGYDSFWVNYPGPVDGLAALALAAAETTRIALGVGVVPLHTCGPDAIVAAVRGERAARRRASCSAWEARTRRRSRACATGSAPFAPGPGAALRRGPRAAHVPARRRDRRRRAPQLADARARAAGRPSGSGPGPRPRAGPSRAWPPTSGSRSGRERRAAGGGRAPLRRDSRLRGPLRAHGCPAGRHGGGGAERGCRARGARPLGGRPRRGRGPGASPRATRSRRRSRWSARRGPLARALAVATAAAPFPASACAKMPLREERS